MKIKTSELNAKTLDWVLAKILFPEWWDGDIDLSELNNPAGIVLDSGEEWSPHSDWSQGGPIIEREMLWLQPEIGKQGAGNAWYAVALTPHDAYGPTPLIAAMRCLVASKLGDEVDVPEELLQ